MTNKTPSSWCVYILECADSTFYTGITNNLSERVKKHNIGKGAKYTRARLPVTIVYHETADDKGKALQREYAIKQFSRQKKIQLIKTIKVEENT